MAAKKKEEQNQDNRYTLYYLEHTTNGHNKFYELYVTRKNMNAKQLQEIFSILGKEAVTSSEDSFFLYSRHGRIGTNGRISSQKISRYRTDISSYAQVIVSKKRAKGYKDTKPTFKATTKSPKEEIVIENTRFARLDLE